MAYTEVKNTKTGKSARIEDYDGTVTSGGSTIGTVQGNEIYRDGSKVGGFRGDEVISKDNSIVGRLRGSEVIDRDEDVVGKVLGGNHEARAAVVLLLLTDK